MSGDTHPRGLSTLILDTVAFDLLATLTHSARLREQRVLILRIWLSQQYDFDEECDEEAELFLLWPSSL